MKGNVKYVIRVEEDSVITVSEMYEQLPLGTLTSDRNGRTLEIKIPLVSHNGKHTISRNIGNDPESMYYDELPVSKVVVSEFEWKIFLRKQKKAA